MGARPAAYRGCLLTTYVLDTTVLIGYLRDLPSIASGLRQRLSDGHTLNRYPLPGATGWPVGVSIGHDRRVVAATSDGRVYGFAPA